MNKLFLIIVILVIAFGFAALLLWRQPITPTPPQQPQPPQPAKEQNILVSEPKPQSTVALQFDLHGLARVFENTLNYELKIMPLGTIAAKNFLTALSPDIGQFGSYATTIKISPNVVPSRTKAVLEVFNYSAKDGSKENIVEVSLTIDPEIKTVQVFFNNSSLNPFEKCELVFGRIRNIEPITAVARTALEQLLKGPRPAEKEIGYSTLIPEGTQLNSLRIENNTAFVDFNEKLDQGIGGSCAVAAIRAQIEETLKQFPTVQRVVISRNGDSETVLQP